MKANSCGLLKWLLTLTQGQIGHILIRIFSIIFCDSYSLLKYVPYITPYINDTPRILKSVSHVLLAINGMQRVNIFVYVRGW